MKKIKGVDKKIDRFFSFVKERDFCYSYSSLIGSFSLNEIENLLDLANKNKLDLKLISYKTNKGKGFALKKGVAKAKHDWIITVDIDLSVKLEQIKMWQKKKTYLSKTQGLFRK